MRMGGWTRMGEHGRAKSGRDEGGLAKDGWMKDSVCGVRMGKVEEDEDGSIGGGFG